MLGSVLATIGLTIPAVLTIGFISGQSVILGLDPTGTILLVLTLAVSTLTFASARTNVLQGAVHLLLFLAYLCRAQATRGIPCRSATKLTSDHLHNRRSIGLCWPAPISSSSQPPVRRCSHACGISRS